MSSQQRMRPNASPSTKPGPLRATVPVAFMRQGSSPTNKKSSPTDSPTLRLPQGLRINRQSPPENRINWSPERKCSPVLQSEKSKTLTLRSGNVSGGAGGQVIRRTASLDALHLGSNPQQLVTGTTHQPQSWTPLQPPATLLSHTYCGRLMVDRATQTPDDWDENERKRSQKKNSESLEMRYMRQRLQRSSGGGGGRVLSPQHQQQQQHPMGLPQGQRQGHLPMGGSPVAMGAGSPLVPVWPSSVSPSMQAHPLCSLVSTPPDGAGSNSSGIRAAPIPIPHIPKPLVPRLRNSVEGLNQEIERLVLKETSGLDTEGSDSDKVGDQALDGHRAPIAKLLHCHQLPQSGSYVRGTSSVDTQTPSGGRGCSGGRSSSGGGSPSPPPLPLLIIPGQTLSRPPSNVGKSASPEASEYVRLCGKTPSDPSPPRIEPFLAREPPDGCEKVKVIEEPSKQPGPSLPLAGMSSAMQGAPVPGLKGSLPRPCMNFVLTPSQRSAFCPLYKPYLPPSSDATLSGASTASVHAVSTASLSANKTQLSPSAPPPTFNEKLQ